MLRITYRVYVSCRCATSSLRHSFSFACDSKPASRRALSCTQLCRVSAKRGVHRCNELQISATLYLTLLVQLAVGSRHRLLKGSGQLAQTVLQSDARVVHWPRVPAQQGAVAGSNTGHPARTFGRFTKLRSNSRRKSLSLSLQTSMNAARTAPSATAGADIRAFAHTDAQCLHVYLHHTKCAA